MTDNKRTLLDFLQDEANALFCHGTYHVTHRHAINADGFGFLAPETHPDYVRIAAGHVVCEWASLSVSISTGGGIAGRMVTFAGGWGHSSLGNVDTTTNVLRMPASTLRTFGGATDPVQCSLVMDCNFSDSIRRLTKPASIFGGRPRFYYHATGTNWGNNQSQNDWLTLITQGTLRVFGQDIILT